jgi:hypothetical protein
VSKTKCVKLKKDILGGLMLCIDPTSGAVQRDTNTTSQAGWAIYDGGEFRSSGVIIIPADPNKENRYRAILDVLLTSFTDPYDIVIMEDIPTARRRGTFNTSQTLIQACGVYAAGISSGKLIELPSHTWQAIARRIGGWIKGDESDARYLGLAAMAFSEGYSQSLTEKKKLECIETIVNKHNGWNFPSVIKHWNL